MTPLCLLLILLASARLGAETVTLDITGRGRVFEGFGALSAGASSKLLIDYHRVDGGFTAIVTIPREVVGWTQAEPGRLMRLDVGYLLGNSTGNRCAQRAYWANNSPTANIIDPVPSKSRLEPSQWGNALLE